MRVILALIYAMAVAHNLLPHFTDWGYDYAFLASLLVLASVPAAFAAFATLPFREPAFAFASPVMREVSPAFPSPFRQV
jgi:hypothetical protein